MSAAGAAWTPGWCMAPAAVLREWMTENGISAGILAFIGGGKERQIASLDAIIAVLERKPLTEDTGAVLQRGTNVPAHVWLALEHNYRAGLAAGLPDVTPDDTPATAPGRVGHYSTPAISPAGYAPAAVVRPGETLVLRYAGRLSEEDIRQIRERAMAVLPEGANVAIVADDFEVEVASGD